MNVHSEKQQERRHYSRTDASLVVSYRPKNLPHGFDISQSKNISQGGILVTTNKAFDKGTDLDVMIRLPLMSEAIEVTGHVIASEPVVPDLIYDTRIAFVALRSSYSERLGEFVQKPDLRYGRRIT